MGAKSTKDTRVCITKGTATPTAVVPTAVSKAKPAEVTVASVTGITKGDVVFVTKTGYPEIDGKMFVVGDVDAVGKTFELTGSDTTGSTGTLAATPSIQHYVAGDMVCICASGVTYNGETPAAISVATFCSPSASISSAVSSAGTVDITGYANIDDADYQELLLASEDGKQRYLRIMSPNNGYWIAPLTFSNISWEWPIDGAASFVANAVLGSKLRHVY